MHVFDNYRNFIENPQILSTISEYAAKDYIDTVYIVPDVNNWHWLNADRIHKLCTDVLEPALNISPKVHGKDTFLFDGGKAAPADSLWLLEHGWKIKSYRLYFPITQRGK